MSKNKQRLAEWATGQSLAVRQEIGSSAVVLADVAQATTARTSGLVGPDTVTFAPAGADQGAGCVPVTGALDQPYSDIAVGDDFVLQAVPYALSQYIPFSGPMLVRVCDNDDLAAYLVDADEAASTGQFPELLRTPNVLLGDRPALGGTADGGGPRDRLSVAPDGTLSTGPWGAPLGTLGDSLQSVAEAYDARNADTVGCAVALATVVDESARRAALAERPWIGRYLAALDAQRCLAARGIGGLRVSGFGTGLAGDQPVTVLAADAPVLLFDDAAGYLFHPIDLRTTRFDLTIARAVEQVFVDPAAARTDPQLRRVVDFFAGSGWVLDRAAAAVAVGS